MIGWEKVTIEFGSESVIDSYYFADDTSLDKMNVRIVIWRRKRRYPSLVWKMEWVLSETLTFAVHVENVNSHGDNTYFSLLPMRDWKLLSWGFHLESCPHFSFC